MGINGCRSARNIELRKLDDRLLLVCTLGKANTQEIEKLLKDGADIHAMRQPEGKTALHLAAHSGALETVKVTLALIVELGVVTSVTNGSSLILNAFSGSRRWARRPRLSGPR